MRKVKKLPYCRQGYVTEFIFTDKDGKEYEVYMSMRAYGIGRGFRGFIKKGSKWYELNEGEKDSLK